MIAILADDLTSALDGASPFARSGLSARLMLDDRHASAAASDVTAWDLDSRFAHPAEARQKFEAAGRAIGSAGLIYKTMDSTLRGNVGAETAGAMRGSGRRHAVVAPAFPAAGRTTVDGRQLVDGVPVDRTDFGRDIRTPVRSASISAILSELPSSCLTVHDASSDADLDNIVASYGLNADLLWVGSPGLGAALARAASSASDRPVSIHRPSVTGRPAARRVLIVVGSLHPANALQLQALEDQGVPSVILPGLGQDIEGCSDALKAAFAGSPTTCFVTSRAILPGGSESAAELAKQVAAIVEHSAASFDGLVITGGDVARRIVDRLGAWALDIVDETEPGIPVGVLHLERGHLPLITKAGGFGRPTSLLDCAGYLQSGQAGGRR